MSMKDYAGEIIAGVVFFGVLLSIGVKLYGIRRDVTKEINAAKKEALDESQQAEMRVNTRINNVLATERERIHAEMARLDKELQETGDLIKSHIEYSRKFHPTNETVFPVLDRLETKLDDLRNHEQAKLEQEVKELKEQLFRERG